MEGLHNFAIPQEQGSEVDEVELYWRLYGNMPPEGLTREELNFAVIDNRGYYRRPREDYHQQEGRE